MILSAMITKINSSLLADNCAGHFLLGNLHRCQWLLFPNAGY
ncbi:hypothetical Protein YC6258_00373 [Gynuella sunshinyii YC6258]|uniref:Uncharacterized protein n=1 Tax=Gynuella sunshinyii YC6258 TaxID=1445510 RepID=A0A0C5VG81_9GAMM|nr:hypothetical Protein YC6258_00373 [Gynuella sunshinyii YC6258]